MPSVLRGQLRFLPGEQVTYRPSALRAVSLAGACAWRRVYAADEYPRLVFKLSPSSDDSSYTAEEIRTFRAIPDYVAPFVQEFHCVVSLGEPSSGDQPKPKRPGAQHTSFHILVCEKLIPLSGVDLTNLCRDETVYRMALGLAAGCRAGFRPRDAGWTIWGLGLRNQRLVSLVLDANSWLRLDEDHNEYGKWPGKKFLASFWAIINEIDIEAARDLEQLVYPQRDAEAIFHYLPRRLAGLNEYQPWNPYRTVPAVPTVVWWRVILLLCGVVFVH